MRNKLLITALIFLLMILAGIAINKIQYYNSFVNKDPTVRNETKVQTSNSPKQITICNPIKIQDSTYFDKENWEVLKLSQVNLEFEYPVQQGAYKYDYEDYTKCNPDKTDVTGEKFELVNSKGDIIAGGISDDYSAGRDGWYTDIKDLLEEDGKYKFVGNIVFFNEQYLDPIAVFKTRYDTNAVLVNFYDFHKNIDDRVATLVEDKKDDKLLFVKLPKNDSSFDAVAILLPNWVDIPTTKRIVDSIKVSENL